MSKKNNYFLNRLLALFLAGVLIVTSCSLFNSVTVKAAVAQVMIVADSVIGDDHKINGGTSVVTSGINALSIFMQPTEQNVTLTVNGENTGYNLSIDREPGDYKASVVTNGSFEVDHVNLNNLDDIIINNGGTLDVNRYINAGNLSIQSGGTLNHGFEAITVSNFSNEGTLNIDALKIGTDDSSIQAGNITSLGTVNAKDVVIAPVSSISDPFANSVINVSNSISFEGFNSSYLPKVCATSPDVTVSSTGGTFELEVSGKSGSVTVSDTAEGTAAEVYKEAYTKSLGELRLGEGGDGLLPSVYAGTDYSFTSELSVPDGYTADVEWIYYDLERAVDQQQVQIEKPKLPGQYGVRAHGVGDDNVNELYSNMGVFTVDFYPANNISLTIEGIDEDGVSEGEVTLIAPQNFTFRLAGTEGEFVSSMTLTDEDLLVDGDFNNDIGFEFKRTDGALTGAVSYEDVASGLSDITFVTPKDDDDDDDDEEEEEEKDEEKEEEKEEEKKEEEKKEEEKKEETPASEGHTDKKETNTTTTTNNTTVSKPAPTITLSVDDQIYGLNYAPNFKSDSSGKVKYLYSKLGENKFTETKPTEPGKYVCRVVQEEYDKYGQGTKDATFSILYLATPDNPYSISGKTGNNGYYVSDVFVSAPDGYTISLTQGGTYEDKVQVSEKTKYVYLKRADGAMTDGIAIKENIIIDAKAPAVSGKATDAEGNEVALGGKLYKDAVSFTMADEHLAKVTVNGESVTVTDGKADINLEANNRHTAYKISAEDEAGNVFTFTVDLYAPWMQSGVIPAGVKVVLEAGSTYTFDEGEWATDIDSTVYTGGMTFYVKEDTEVTFIKVK